MKIKHVFMTLGLAAVLGLGVGAGLQVGKVNEAKAATKKLYVCVEDSGWGTPMIHYWGGEEGSSWESTPSLTFDGYYTSNSYEGFVFTFDLPSDITHFLIRNEGGSKQTSNYDFASNWGECSNEGVRLKGETLTLANPHTDLTQKVTEGYYLCGNDKLVTETGGNVAGAWKYSQAVKMDTTSDSNKAISILTVSQTVEFKVRELYGTGENWHGDSNNGDNNFSLSANTWVIYVNQYNNASASVGVDAASFSAAFLADMQGICGSTEERWDEDNSGSALNTVWAEYKDLFDSHMRDGEVEKFVIGSSNSDIDRAAKLYLHCHRRYSLTAWTDVPASSNSVNYSVSNSNNTLTIAIVAVSAISLLAIGGFFFIRKRKEER